MNDRWKQFAELAERAKVFANGATASVRDTASKASEASLATGKAAGVAIASTAEDLSLRLKPHLEEAAIEGSRRAKQLSGEAAVRARAFKDRLTETANKLDQNHEAVAAKVETVSMAAGIAAGVAGAAAWIAAPSGLAALAVFLGVRSAPGAVRIAAVLGVVAMVAGFISGVAYFYSMWKRKRVSRKVLAGRTFSPL